MPQIEIPAFLKHLKVADHGYPIPFFVKWIDGKPDFRVLDDKKYEHCYDQKLCSICGKKLMKASYWFISGPKGFENRVSTDMPMHEYCARYSMETCPHIVMQKADRRTKGIEHMHNAPGQIMEKPDEFYMVKAKSYTRVKDPRAQGAMVSYKATAYEVWGYEDGRISQSQELTKVN